MRVCQRKTRGASERSPRAQKRKTRCGRARSDDARRRTGGARVPSPHTPVTLLSAAHSGSARPTPTDEANGPAGIVPREVRAARLAAAITRATGGESVDVLSRMQSTSSTARCCIGLSVRKGRAPSLLRDVPKSTARRTVGGRVRVAARVAASGAPRTRTPPTRAASAVLPTRSLAAWARSTRVRRARPNSTCASCTASRSAARCASRTGAWSGTRRSCGDGAGARPGRRGGGTATNDRVTEATREEREQTMGVRTFREATMTG